MKSFEVHSEQHDSHWVAWVTKAGEQKPHRSVLVVGPSQKEAEARARQWAETASE
jgi:hypothetical protein